MAAPDYVPVPLSDKPREPLAMPPNRRWMADRPADLQRGQPRGRHLGKPGPDQGYALKLAELMEPRIVVAAGETIHDAKAGCGAVALRRASIFGRAPVIHDLELAFRLWGFFEGAPADLAEYRRPLFSGASHHYLSQRHIADVVPEATLRLTPATVAARLGEWRELLRVS
ncbi:MAG: hypothetical protein M3179_13605 [Actinomycetota bacterium]|nr:hypothetical protein [Actinomycetota bacterium]